MPLKENLAAQFDFLKAKAPPLVGCDISSSSVKMVEIAEAGRNVYRVERYAIEPLPKDTVVDGNIARTSNITIAGGGFSLTNFSSYAGGEQALDMVIDPNDANTVYVATLTRIFQTTDGGAHWTNLTDNLGSLYSAGYASFAGFSGLNVLPQRGLALFNNGTASQSDDVIRSIHVAGTLTFAANRDTELNVGLIKIQPGDDASEDGFNCDAHPIEPDPKQPKAALEVGSPEKPLDAKFTAKIRLHFVEGMDKESCPAIVCCGGRLDLHGAPMSRTWLKLGATAKNVATPL